MWRYYTMRFSVIVPAYNSSAWIRKALDSIKQQTFKDYELIVVCDSCTDDTEQIAKEYGAVTKAVNFHRDGLTRNAGLDMAQGEYILFMDDDDWWMHEFVLKQLDKKLKELDNPDVLCFSFIFKHWKYAEPRCDSYGNRWVAVWNKCWKRSFIGDTRFPGIEKISDRYFNDEMTKKEGRWEDWDMPMLYYNYFRKGSQTQVTEKTMPEYFKRDW